MKLKKELGLLLLSLILILSGCTGNPFTTNFFESLDQVEADINTGALDAADSSNPEELYGAVDDLLGEQDADDFEDYLKGDSGDSIINALTDLIENTTPTEAQEDTYQEAGVLLAQAELVNDGIAADAVSAVSSELGNIMDSADDADSDFMESMLGTIFDTQDSATLVNSLTAMIDAADALRAVGSTINTVNPEDDMSPGIDLAEAADSAIVICMVDALVSQTLSEGNSIADIANFIIDGGDPPFTITDSNDLTFDPDINKIVTAGTDIIDFTDLPF